MNQVNKKKKDQKKKNTLMKMTHIKEMQKLNFGI